MSKGNIFLGFGRGAIGDLILTHLKGVQVARARNRQPYNPRTDRQIIQRVFMKTTSLAYSFFQELCNHSFEGFAKGTPCQSQFAKVNIADMRRKFADVFDAGSPIDSALVSQRFNYSKKSDYMCEINDYIISQGTLRPMNAVIYGTADNNVGCVLPFVQDCGQELIYSDVDYAAIVKGLNLQQGDQLTFVLAACDDEVDAVEQVTGFYPRCKYTQLDYFRVILEPDDGQMDDIFIGDDEISGGYGYVGSPNPRNKDVALRVGIVPASERFPFGGLGFYTDWQNMAKGMQTTTMACAVIASRLGTNGRWLRSTERMAARPDRRLAPGQPISTMQIHSVDYMIDAINSFKGDTNSSLYLNQSK